jgi:hypothetical protein
MQTKTLDVKMQTMEDSRIDERFRQVDQRFDRLEASIATLGSELREEIRESNAELRTEIRTLTQVGGGLIGTVIVALGGIIATQI